jgi:hypothetical protein
MPVFIAPSFPRAANRVAQKGKTPLMSANAAIKYGIKDHVPNSPGPVVETLVSSRRKMTPVNTLIICDANMMKPEYRTRISLLDSLVAFYDLRVLTFGLCCVSD